MHVGAVLLELALASALVMDRRHRSRMLLVGLAFHDAIALLHGLGSLFLATAGALVLYLAPPDAALPALSRAAALRRAVMRTTARLRRMLVPRLGARGVTSESS